MCWFCDGKVVGLLSPYSITVVYMPGTSIGFSVSAVSSSCLRTKEQDVNSFICAGMRPLAPSHVGA